MACRTGRSTPGSSPTSDTLSISPTRTPSSPCSDAYASMPRPVITLSSTAASSTVRAIGPTVSSVGARAKAPMRSTAPCVGRTPTTPQTLAGKRIEPPVSVPTPATVMPAATAEAVPPDEPPAEKSPFQGLRMSPKVSLRPVMSAANSAILFLPRNTAPAARSATTTAASVSALAAYALERDPAVVRTSATSNRSFTEIGMPCSGPRSVPAANSASSDVAWRSASSAVTSMKACRSGREPRSVPGEMSPAQHRSTLRCGSEHPRQRSTAILRSLSRPPRCATPAIPASPGPTRQFPDPPCCDRSSPCRRRTSGPPAAPLPLLRP